MVEGDPYTPTWKFTQCFGDKGDVEDITEADIISTVEFDHTGNYLATGDKGGRVVLFERNETKKTCEYRFHTEFQSHEPEFDYLKSLEIEEKINRIKWCKRQNASHYLLSTNDKTIKLWKVFEKSLKVVAENNLSHDLTPGGVTGGGAARSMYNVHFSSPHDLKMPRLTHHDTVVAAVPRRTYANAHAYHINSISVNSDGETFISSDDLRINLWNLNIQDRSFNIVDIKPANMEELTEVITAAEFHPESCNWFMFASSKGTIKLADMRESALCDHHAKQFEQEEDPTSRSFFSEIISSISDVRFSHDGRYILSRDYLTVKIWDVNMERHPVKTIPIHEHLRPRLCDTYENDSIFDKFEVVFSGDGRNVMTGSYNNNFMIYPSDPLKEVEVVLQADKSAFKAKKVGVPTPINLSTSPTATNGGKKGGPRTGSPGGTTGQGGRMKKETDADQIDFHKKILHMSWHPFEDSIAIAATNNVSALSTSIVLKSKVDWEPWVELIQTSANEYDVWKFVNPMVKKENLAVLTEPKKPTYSDVKASTEQNTSIAYSSLSPDEKEEFRQLKEDYNTEKKQYREQQLALGRLRIKIQESVDVAYLPYTYKCETVHDMLVKLSDRFAPTDNIRRQEVLSDWNSSRFNEVSKEDFDDWIQKWEVKFHQMKELNLPDVEGTRPVEDFLNVASSIDYQFAKTWVLKLAMGEDISLTDLLRIFRNYRRSSANMLKTQPKRGAFGATLNGLGINDQTSKVLPNSNQLNDIEKLPKCPCGF
ncbi:protein phosphatase 2A regulatory subunit PR55, partial [Erysiphe pulchra]